MMDYKKTYDLLDVFYESCFEFWMGEGKDEYAAHALAVLDVEGVVTNPFSPIGDTLDPEAKVAFIRHFD